MFNVINVGVLFYIDIIKPSNVDVMFYKTFYYWTLQTFYHLEACTSYFIQAFSRQTALMSFINRLFPIDQRWRLILNTLFTIDQRWRLFYTDILSTTSVDVFFIWSFYHIPAITSCFIYNLCTIDQSFTPCFVQTLYHRPALTPCFIQTLFYRPALTSCFIQTSYYFKHLV